MTTDGPALTPQHIDEVVAAAFPGSAAGACAEVGPDHALLRRAIDPAGARPGGFVPGPVQFAMVDAALWYLTFGVLDRIELMALTSDVDITFLRPASGEVLWARAELLSAGRRKVVGAVRVWCDDRRATPCAVAKGTYVLPTDR